MSLVNNCMLYLLEIGCLVLVSKKESELLTGAWKEKKQRKKAPPC